jgi:hypothetical protein
VPDKTLSLMKARGTWFVSNILSDSATTFLEEQHRATSPYHGRAKTDDAASPFPSILFLTSD